MIYGNLVYKTTFNMGCIFLSCHKTGRLLRNTSVTAALSQLHQSSQLVHPLFVLQWASSYYEWNNMAKNFRKGPRLKDTLSCHCIHCIVFFLTTLFSQVDIAMPLCWLGLSHGRVAMPKIIACVFFYYTLNGAIVDKINILLRWTRLENELKPVESTPAVFLERRQI